ncbi:MAG: tRNA pseudouridine synthase A [Micrococcales bacterium]|nr:tRNA pseudouridine synthase A [Micrococcales bacterium]
MEVLETQQGVTHDGGTRLRLDLAYDGAGFHGWAAQPGLRTVQGEVGAALGRVLRLGGPVVPTAAGRTDAGVHARGQVAHVDVPSPEADARGSAKHVDVPGPGMDARGQVAHVDLQGHGPVDTGRLLRSLGAVLAADVRVKSVGLAPEGFDARFSALSRHYCYRIADSPAGCDPTERGFVWWSGRELSVSVMNAAGGALLGTHDFAAFARPREGASTVRTLLQLEAVRVGEGRIDVHVAADAFCHNQVRAMVGALVAVGSERRPVEWVAQALDSGSREGCATVLPAQGLTLESVTYPADKDMAAQARAARVVRSQNDP